jgi:spermidine synthase
LKQQASLRRCALLLAAALIGAGGLAGEAILLSTAGLALGFGRASAFGLACFVAGYALGAWRSGKFRGRGRIWLQALALPSLLTAWLGARAMLVSAAAGWSAPLAGSLTCFALLAAGMVQGALLPALVRIDIAFAAGRGVALLFAANLCGSVLGARWIGFDLVAEFGRSAAALGAGVAACAGALIAAFLIGLEPQPELAESASRAAAQPELSRASAALLAGLGTAWAISLEWIGLRHALLWLESQQATLNAVLTASLTALAVGALLASLLPRGRAGVLALIPFAIAGTAWVAIGAPWASAHAAGSRYGFALLLLGPALLAFGAWIPALHRASSGEVGARLGDLLLHEAWGALLGAPLVHALLVPNVGLGGALAALTGLGGLLALVAAGAERRLVFAGLPIAAIAGGAGWWMARAPQPVLISPLYADPALTVRSLSEDAQFAVGVVDDGIQGERTLLTDRFRAAGTGRDYTYMRALGHLPLLLHPAPRRVAVMCLGTGTTLGAAFQHDEVERIDVLEISPAVVAAAPWFTQVNHGALEPAARARVHVRLGDGRRLLADSPGEYDVLTMEPLLPDSPFGVYLYTSEFYRVAARSLAPGGIVCQWVPPHALEPRVFDAVVDSFSRAFPWSGRFLFGSQLVLIGAAREPVLDSTRFPASATALSAALSEVNLENPASLLTTFCGASDWPGGARPLSDDTPWIVFEDKPKDARVFTWLSSNLGVLDQRSRPPPKSWKIAAGEHAERFEHAGSVLARARLDAAAFETGLRTAAAQAGDSFAGSAHLRELASSSDAGALGRALVSEQRFLACLRAGVSLIGSDAQSAADRLLEAAELRPERADVHLYVAAAMQRLGSARAARAAYARALELCPRALETSAGLRALKLGLPQGPE